MNIIYYFINPLTLLIAIGLFLIFFGEVEKEDPYATHTIKKGSKSSKRK